MLLFCRLDDGQPRLMVAGGKGVGKSTFLRFLVNRVLAEVGAPVLVVDLDPGQAEFTVPGLSLYHRENAHLRAAVVAVRAERSWVRMCIILSLLFLNFPKEFPQMAHPLLFVK